MANPCDSLESFYRKLNRKMNSIALNFCKTFDIILISYVLQIAQNMEKPKHSSSELQTVSHVFVRRDKSKATLDPPYEEDSYTVIDRDDHHFKVDVTEATTPLHSLV